MIRSLELLDELLKCTKYVYIICFYNIYIYVYLYICIDRSDQIRSDQVRSGQVRSDQIRSDRLDRQIRQLDQIDRLDRIDRQIRLDQIRFDSDRQIDSVKTCEEIWSPSMAQQWHGNVRQGIAKRETTKRSFMQSFLFYMYRFSHSANRHNRGSSIYEQKVRHRLLPVWELFPQIDR